MYAWEAIQKTLDSIEEHLSENIGIEGLAGTASLSPYYYQRLFARLVKKPVNEYIKLRRLAVASESLRDKDRRILDIALDCGFSDHPSFTRAFKEAYGVTPDEYRAGLHPLNHFVKPDLSLNHMEVDEGVPLVADGVVVEMTRRKLLSPRHFAGIAGEIPETELSAGRDTGVSTAWKLWEDFHRQKSSVAKMKPKGSEFGMVYRGDARDGCCMYMVGAEVIDGDNAEGNAFFTLPCGEYLVCHLEAENFTELIGNAMPKALTFMNSWMKRRRLVNGGFCTEIYENANAGESSMEFWVPHNPSEETLIAQKRWDRSDGTHTPSLDEIANNVNNPLWEKLRTHLEETYKCAPRLEYSRCSAQYGWNVKYKKAGRTLCTLYPMEGYYIALIVIAEQERMETELALSSFTPYLQSLYHETKTGMGQKWLMIRVEDDEVLEDVKRCLAIRGGKKSGYSGGK